MQHIDFLEKYKNIKYNFLHCWPFNMKLLCAIHYYLFDGIPYCGMVRYSEKDMIYLRIERIVTHICLLSETDIPIEEFIDCVCRSVAIIHMYQPFYDGNTRACLILQKLLLQQKGLELELDSEIDKDLIAVIYSEKDQLGNAQTVRLKQRIKQKIS